MVTKSHTEKIDDFFRNATHATVGLIEKGCYSQEKCWFEAVISLIWKLIEYASDHSLDKCIPINSHILEKKFITKVTGNFLWKNCI